jgi:hypothetical protein
MAFRMSAQTPDFQTAAASIAKESRDLCQFEIARRKSRAAGRGGLVSADPLVHGDQPDSNCETYKSRNIMYVKSVH